MTRSLTACWATIVLTLVVLPATASELERTLERQLAGAWVLILTESYSDCAGFYNNNQVGAVGVASRADRRFAPGELAKIDKINLKSDRLDLFLTLGEPLLVSRSDGPFELYDERECKVQLLVDVPRTTVRSGDAAAVIELLAPTVEIFGSQPAARAAEHSNRRVREPYPPDYERTLARHAVWQAEQTNAAVAARSDAAIDDANRVLRDLRGDPDFLAGFAAGVDALRDWRETSCERLADASFSWARKSPPREHAGDSSAARSWREGWEAGQETLFNLALADRLRGCYVQPPTLPPD